MSARIQSSFPAFELTIAVALVLIGWAALKLYELGPEATESQQAVIQLRDRYFEISNSIETNIVELDDSLVSFLEGKDGVAIAEFQRQSEAWSHWLAERRLLWGKGRLPMTPAGGATNQITKGEADLVPLLDRVESTYTNYLKAARFLMARGNRSVVDERFELRQQGAQRAKQNLLNIARKARMQGQTLDVALANTQQELGTLTQRIRDVRLGLLLAVVAVSFLLMLVLYRGKVAQARAMIQEHNRQHLKQQATLDKLAHFGQLAQELAHEIKQPLTAMNARAYTLQKMLAAGTESHKDAAVIRSEIKRLDQIVKDFLELARPAEPQLTPLPACQALSEIRELMTAHFSEKSIEFKFDCEDELKFAVDLPQLKQVLINLLKNAGESLDHGGSGTVTLRAKSENRLLKGEMTDVAVIEVEDTGPGIPPEIQSKIFDPFFSTKGDGTGLGLAIAARIIDKHGGNLEFDTELGKGTIFRIVLPACRKELPA